MASASRVLLWVRPSATRRQRGGVSCGGGAFDIVERFLADRLLTLPVEQSPTSWAYDCLVGTGGTERIGEVAASIGWSRKHLAAKFRDEVGLTPKLVARIARFNVALRRARQGDNLWAELASECGYADQAHLVRDFNKFAGDSPTGWQARLAQLGA